MSKEGWIRLYRRIEDSWIWDDKPFDKRSAWIDLLLSANHKDKKVLFNGKLIVIKEGQLVTSVRKLADRWGWSKDKVIAFLKLLERDEMIKKESNNSNTILTIKKYTVYQSNQSGASSTKNSGDSHKNRDSEKDITKKDEETISEEQLRENYQTMCSYYPKDDGKTNAYPKYKEWVLTGRMVNGKLIKLTDIQMWNAMMKYIRQMEDDGKDIRFYKNFDNLLSDSIIDYVEGGTN